MHLFGCLLQYPYPQLPGLSAKIVLFTYLRRSFVGGQGRRALEATLHYSITPLGVRAHGSTKTGMPSQANFNRYSAFQFASRKQPCDSVRPTCSGLGVP